MTEYCHLVGADDVSRAGYVMRDAAAEMNKAAGLFNESITFHLNNRMEEWVARIEAAADRITTALERNKEQTHGRE
jgi:hypothetical protein